MIILRHEAWSFGDGLAFYLAGHDAEAFHARISGPGKREYVVYAASYEEAMQAHYERQGWGTYKPAPEGADNYTTAQLERQLVEYPDDEALRCLNGLAD